MNKLQKKFVKEIKKAKKGDIILFNEALGIIKNVTKFHQKRTKRRKHTSER